MSTAISSGGAARAIVTGFAGREGRGGKIKVPLERAGDLAERAGDWLATPDTAARAWRLLIGAAGFAFFFAGEADFDSGDRAFVVDFRTGVDDPERLWPEPLAREAAWGELVEAREDTRVCGVFDFTSMPRLIAKWPRANTARDGNTVLRCLVRGPGSSRLRLAR